MPAVWLQDIAWLQDKWCVPWSSIFLHSYLDCFFFTFLVTHDKEIQGTLIYSKHLPLYKKSSVYSKFCSDVEIGGFNYFVTGSVSTKHGMLVGEEAERTFGKLSWPNHRSVVVNLEQVASKSCQKDRKVLYLGHDPFACKSHETSYKFQSSLFSSSSSSSSSSIIIINHLV